MIPHSSCLIITGSSLIASTHAASHGAGQISPVNSGKLLVACRRSIASRHSPRRTRSFHSGIRLPSGQPWWQNGMPQSMQRRPCSRSSSAGSVRKISWWSRVRVRGSRSRRRDALDLEEPARIGHHAASASSRSALERALVLVRDDLHERRRVEVGEHVGRRLAAGALAVLERAARRRSRSSSASSASRPTSVWLQRGGELAVDVEHVRDPAAHARREVAPGRPEHEHVPAGHVLAAVVADALDDRVGAGVAHREALARQPAEERAAAVAPYSVVLPAITSSSAPARVGRPHRDHAARQSLARVVVDVAAARSARRRAPATRRSSAPPSRGTSPCTSAVDPAPRRSRRDSSPPTVRSRLVIGSVTARRAPARQRRDQLARRAAPPRLDRHRPRAALAVAAAARAAA